MGKYRLSEPDTRQQNMFPMVRQREKKADKQGKMKGRVKRKMKRLNRVLKQGSVHVDKKKMEVDHSGHPIRSVPLLSAYLPACGNVS